MPHTQPGTATTSWLFFLVAILLKHHSLERGWSRVVKECWASEDFGKGELVLAPMSSWTGGVHLGRHLWRIFSAHPFGNVDLWRSPARARGILHPIPCVLGPSHLGSFCWEDQTALGWQQGPPWVHWTTGMERAPCDNSSGERGMRHPNLTPWMLQDVHHHWSRACLQQPRAKQVWYLNSTLPCQAIPEQLNEWNSSWQIYKMHTGLRCFKKYHPILTFELYKLCFQPLQMRNSLLVSLQVQRVY